MQKDVSGLARWGRNPVRAFFLPNKEAFIVSIIQEKLYENFQK